MRCSVMFKNNGVVPDMWAYGKGRDWRRGRMPGVGQAFSQSRKADFSSQSSFSLMQFNSAHGSEDVGGGFAVAKRKECSCRSRYEEIPRGFNKTCARPLCWSAAINADGRPWPEYKTHPPTLALLMGEGWHKSHLMRTTQG